MFISTLVITTLAVVAQHQHPAGTIGDKLGTVNFPISCSETAKPAFARGLALLHSFEFGPAIESFTAAATADPSCGIASWGIALSRWGNPFAAGIKGPAVLTAGSEAVAKAKAMGAKTDRERAYIDAVSNLFADAETRNQRTRTLAYRDAMKAVAARYSDDPEAAAFYALSLASSQDPTDMTYASLLEAGAILEKLAPAQPDHPGFVHYIIHSYDAPPLASKALSAAQAYAKIAPSAPHALHMPSHTVTRVGFWDESAATNVNSERTALEQNVIGEALHAMDYQTYAYLQMARDKSALTVLQRTPGTVAKLDVNAVGGAAPGAAGVYAAAAIPARYALERGAWAEAASLVPTASAFPFADAVTHFARALGAARSGKPAAARLDVDRLAALRDKLTNDDYWREQVDIQRRVALAWVTFAEGRRDEAIALLRAAADSEDGTDKSAISPGPLAPARELLGEMLLEAGNAREALVAFEATMAKEPGRFRGAYGAARAAEASGDRSKARQLYQSLLNIAKSSEAERPELQRARAFLKSA